MECNRDEAVRAKAIAEGKLDQMDYVGARQFALKAQTLFPALDDISQLLTILDVYVRAENKIGGEVDWYRVLNVDPTADVDAIKKQYKMFALQLHPDKNKSKGADGAFKLISEAWTLLQDEVKRSKYNEKVFRVRTRGPPPCTRAPFAHTGFPSARTSAPSPRPNATSAHTGAPPMRPDVQLARPWVSSARPSFASWYPSGPSMHESIPSVPPMARWGFGVYPPYMGAYTSSPSSHSGASFGHTSVPHAHNNVPPPCPTPNDPVRNVSAFQKSGAAQAGPSSGRCTTHWQRNVRASQKSGAAQAGPSSGDPSATVIIHQVQTTVKRSRGGPPSDVLAGNAALAARIKAINNKR